MNTHTAVRTLADQIRHLVKNDNDAPRLLLEELRQIPELGILTAQVAAEMDAENQHLASKNRELRIELTGEQEKSRKLIKKIRKVALKAEILSAE
jgi:hypothetical protein